MSLAKKLKMIVKGEKKPTFGTDPNEPWSVRAGITEGEAGALASYLKSRGINPDFVSKDTKISHAKSAEFSKWKRDHLFDDPADTVSSVQRDKMKSQREEVELDETMTTKHTPFEKRQHLLKKSTHMNKVVSSAVKPAGGLAPGLTAEAVDKEDTITFDIPLLIRMFEFAREDAKTDMDLHKVTEKLISIRNRGTLTMADYDFVVKLKEELDWDTQLAESPKEGGRKKFSGMYNPAPKGTFAYDQAMRKKKHDEIMKQQSKDGSGMTSAIDRLQKHLNKEEVTEAVSDKTVKQIQGLFKQAKAGKLKTGKNDFTKGDHWKGPDKDDPSYTKNFGHGYPDTPSNRSHDRYVNKSLKKEEVELDEMDHKFVDSLNKLATKYDFTKSPSGKEVPKQKKPIQYMGQVDLQKKMNKEDVYQDTQAATQTPCDLGTTPDQTVPTYSHKKEMSKSARIIKSLYKHHNMKEEIYDHEKEDKSVATYGKKPKVEKIEAYGDEDNQAAMVLKGGKTLTGQTRDTLEIDPVMRKPVRPDNKISDRKTDK